MHTMTILPICRTAGEITVIANKKYGYNLDIIWIFDKFVKIL